ncbi:hypothetical protein [Streptomyces gelaticus]|uniref:hypothetical protein n=1 Tax=Streptomyces gelaticus TaxID=285446 RepID=UPI001E4C1C80|nr:hypothetical protein [Streptomyces gelaticus]
MDWDRYPVEEYARQVLSTFDLTDHVLRIDSREKLAALRHLPSVKDLAINGCFTSAELRTGLRGGPWNELIFRQNPCMTELSFLADCAEQLKGLFLGFCPAVRDLGPLAALPALRLVDLDMSRVPYAALAATASKALDSLKLNRLTAERLSQLPAQRELRSLTINGTVPLEIDSLEGWTRLQKLELETRTPVRPLLAALRRSPQVAHVALSLPSLTECADERPVPSVESLVLALGTDMLGLDRIPRVFPGPRWVMLAPPTDVVHVDLTPLQAMPRCRVIVTGRAEITGGEGLDVGR